MLDVCVAPSAPSRLRLASGAALSYRENGKKTAYDPIAALAGSRFVPFALESFGGLGQCASAFLRDLSTYPKESYLTLSEKECVSSMAVLLQKGNAEMLAQGVLMVRRPALH